MNRFFNKVADVLRETKDGFTRGQLIIEGVGHHQNEEIVIHFQNEYLVAKWKTREVSSTAGSKIEFVITTICSNNPDTIESLFLFTQDVIWTSIKRLLDVMDVGWTSKQRYVLTGLNRRIV